MLDLAAGHTQPSQAQQIAAHDQPIRCIESLAVNGTPMVVTGGWDKLIPTLEELAGPLGLTK